MTKSNMLHRVAVTCPKAMAIRETGESPVLYPKL